MTHEASSLMVCNALVSSFIWQHNLIEFHVHNIYKGLQIFFLNDELIYPAGNHSCWYIYEIYSAAVPHVCGFVWVFETTWGELMQGPLWRTAIEYIGLYERSTNYNCCHVFLSTFSHFFYQHNSMLLFSLLSTCLLPRNPSVNEFRKPLVHWKIKRSSVNLKLGP